MLHEDFLFIELQEHGTNDNFIEFSGYFSLNLKNMALMTMMMIVKVTWLKKKSFWLTS